MGASEPRSRAPVAGGAGPSRVPILVADDVWRWDAAHNPLPLSPAQAGLVALVDRRCAIGLRQRIVGGYLFYATDPGSSTTPLEPAEALRALGASAAARLAQPAPTLDEALETFISVYQPLFGVVQPNARAMRGVLAAFLRRRGFDPTPASTQALHRRPLRGHQPRASGPGAGDGAIGRGAPPGARGSTSRSSATRRRAGTSPRRPGARRPRGSSGWCRGDIGPPVGARAWRDAADAVSARLPADARDEWEERLKVARTAAGVAEDDDVLYARIQAHVRQALLRAGGRLVARGVLGTTDEISGCRWSSCGARRGARSPSPTKTSRPSSSARSAPTPRPAPPTAGGGGRQHRPRRRHRAGPPGRDRRPHRPGPSLRRAPRPRPGRRSDLVARTLLPTELPLLAPAAIVVETGGLLDHVAAQARERGIPAVVGAVGACRLLREGDQVLVDGGAGLVVRLG